MASLSPSRPPLRARPATWYPPSSPHSKTRGGTKDTAGSNDQLAGPEGEQRGAVHGVCTPTVTDVERMIASPLPTMGSACSTRRGGQGKTDLDQMLASPLSAMDRAGNTASCASTVIDYLGEEGMSPPPPPNNQGSPGAARGLVGFIRGEKEWKDRDQLYLTGNGSSSESESQSE